MVLHYTCNVWDDSSTPTNVDTDMNKIEAIAIRADQVTSGMVVIGPRGFRVKAERIDRTAMAVTIHGINGFGEGVKFRKDRRAKIEYLHGEATA